MTKFLWSIISKYLQEKQTFEFKIQSFYVNPYLKNVEVKILSQQKIWVDLQDKHLTF